MTRLIVWMLGLCVLGTAYGQMYPIRQDYTIDVTPDAADSFTVTLDVGGLTEDSIVYQFAAASPGSYQPHDAGRFVGSFRSWAADGTELQVTYRYPNQFVLYEGRRISRVTYRVDDTFGHPSKVNVVSAMSGTSIDHDYALLNTHMTFGYFEGYRKTPASIVIKRPAHWKAGTSLVPQQGRYITRGYDDLVDHPFLLGELTSENFTVGGMKVEIFCHSPTQNVTAKKLKDPVKTVLKAAEKYLQKMPVDRYVFLFKFVTQFDGQMGAHEHRQSSTYVLPEKKDSKELKELVIHPAAHEFFHVITPLTLRSDVIDQFNFVEPVPTRHLWFFEGCTEWASLMMLMRGGVLKDQEFALELVKKMNQADKYDPTVSLVDLSLGSFGNRKSEYGNVYQKGALTALLLDMKLLELSQGRRGLREVIMELYREYGLQRSFSDSAFFDLFVQKTHPEVRDFLEAYVSGAEPLPYAVYYGKAGYSYSRYYHTGKYQTSFGRFSITSEDGRIMVIRVDSTHELTRLLGIRVGDQVTGIVVEGQEYSIQDERAGPALQRVQPGDPMAWRVIRDGQEILLRAVAGRQEVVIDHLVIPMKDLSKDQKHFRKWWLGRL